MGFKKDFVWGTATASYQIEGGVYDGGRGWTVWDEFCRIPGKVFSGHNGDVATDHYHRFEEDVMLMKELGQKAYRFSIAWSRIYPEGFGKVNPEGLDFYNKLVDLLLENDIEPYVTLFHWDLPYGLFRLGGWQNPAITDYFAEYSATVAKSFGEKVKNYITLNEPQCFIGLGHVTGEHAPGNLMSQRSVLEMAHNVMLAHGKAVVALRTVAPHARIGYAPTCNAHYPLTNSPEDIEAARKANFDIVPNPANFMWNIPWWSDPVIFGKYPEEGLELYKDIMPKIAKGDMEIISTPIDFYCQNIYNGFPIKDDGNGGFEYVDREEGYPRVANGWPVTPEALYWGPRYLYERYKLPFYISENGTATHDTVSLDGKVHDPDRINFIHRYLRCLKRAAEDGVLVEGYFYWAFTDNFEWAKGYNDRFGLVYVDFKTKERIIKDSGYWYRDVIKENGENL
jgi:beta-glucosidase